MELSLSNNILLEMTPVNLKNHQCFRDNENFCGLENNVIQQHFISGLLIRVHDLANGSLFGVLCPLFLHAPSPLSGQPQSYSV